VCRRVLQTLTRPRPTHSRSLRPSGRRRTDAEPVTRQHTTTVEVTTDNPDPRAPARATGSRSRSRRWCGGSQATLPYAVRHEFTGRLLPLWAPARGLDRNRMRQLFSRGLRA
jgi:hypothetical protein